MTTKPMPDWLHDMCDEAAINRAIGNDRPVPYANRAMTTRPGAKQNDPVSVQQPSKSEDATSKGSSPDSAVTEDEGGADNGKNISAATSLESAMK